MKLVSTAAPNLSRRRFLTRVGAIAGAALLNGWGCSEDIGHSGPCPGLAGRQIHWIVPYAAGGGFDADSRLLEPFYEQKLNVEIVIENVAGGAGIAGARKLQTAVPDGLTQGILSAPGLLVASLTGETEAPNPATDFTILGRLARTQQVWATSGRSALRTVDDVFKAAQQRPILFGSIEVGGTDFVDSVVSSWLVGLNPELVTGFPNSRSASLAVIRGEVDVICFNFDSIVNFIESGELRPLLQISDEPISDHRSLQGVALLGGESGWAARRAADTGREIGDALADAEGLSNLVGAGRLVVAPPGMDERLSRCLSESLHQVLTDPDFQSAATTANRSINAARADVARAEIQAAAKQAERFVPVVRQAIQKIRG